MSYFDMFIWSYKDNPYDTSKPHSHTYNEVLIPAYYNVSKPLRENHNKKYLNGSGQYYLDIASGLIGFQEYIDLSEKFEIRICIDIAFNPLVEAQNNLKGQKGISIVILIGGSISSLSKIKLKFIVGGLPINLLLISTFMKVYLANRF
jgi:hypothetical protein